MTEKVCRCCGEAKPLIAFPVDRRRLDGHRTDCSSCNAVSWQERVRNKPEIYAAHLQRQATALREKYRDDPVFRAKQKARGLANHQRRRDATKAEP
jgi:hypothetical protein